MTLSLTRSPSYEIILAIPEDTIFRDNTDRSITFISILISVLLGTISIGCNVAKGDKEKLESLLNLMIPPGCANHSWLISILKGVKKQETYQQLETLSKLSDRLSLSEKILIVSIGYKLAIDNQVIDARKNNYLRKIADCFCLDICQIDVLEARLESKINVDRKVLNSLSDLLEPGCFRALDPGLVVIAREIHQSLLSLQSDCIPSHSIPDSKEPDRFAAQIEDCHTTTALVNSTRLAQHHASDSPIDSQTLWLQLGEFSGLDVQIRNSRDGFKQKALERADAVWEDWFQGLEASLKTQWYPEARKTKKQDKESGDRTWGEWLAVFDRFQEEWFSKEGGEDKIENPAQLSQTYAVQFTQELKLALRAFIQDSLHSSLESLDLTLKLMQQRIRDLDETLEILLAHKLLSPIAKAMDRKTLVESFDWEDRQENKDFSLDLTPMVDDVMESVLQIKRGRSRSQIRQKVFDRGWKRFAKSKDKIRTTIREEIDRLWDEQVTLTLSLLDDTIELYAALLKRDMTA